MHMQFLESLDERNIRNGTAEMIKKAALFDSKYFDDLCKYDLVELI